MTIKLIVLGIQLSAITFMIYAILKVRKLNKETAAINKKTREMQARIMTRVDAQTRKFTVEIPNSPRNEMGQ